MVSWIGTRACRAYARNYQSSSILTRIYRLHPICKIMKHETLESECSTLSVLLLWVTWESTKSILPVNWSWSLTAVLTMISKLHLWQMAWNLTILYRWLGTKRTVDRLHWCQTCHACWRRFCYMAHEEVIWKSLIFLTICLEVCFPKNKGYRSSRSLDNHIVIRIQSWFNEWCCRSGQSITHVDVLAMGSSIRWKSFGS